VPVRWCRPGSSYFLPAASLRRENTQPPSHGKSLGNRRPYSACPMPESYVWSNSAGDHIGGAAAHDSTAPLRSIERVAIVSPINFLYSLYVPAKYGTEIEVCLPDMYCARLTPACSWKSPCHRAVVSFVEASLIREHPMLGNHPSFYEEVTSTVRPPAICAYGRPTKWRGGDYSLVSAEVDDNQGASAPQTDLGACCNLFVEWLSEDIAPSCIQILTERPFEIAI
jgi:hypothetical protein